MTISGHPSLELVSVVDNQTPIQITICANCGGLKTILFLDEDRWFCARCKEDGVVAPKMFAVNRPRRKNG